MKIVVDDYNRNNKALVSQKLKIGAVGDNNSISLVRAIGPVCFAAKRRKS